MKYMSQEKTYKEKALDHVRSVCRELMELSFGCEVSHNGYPYIGKYIGLNEQGQLKIQTPNESIVTWNQFIGDITIIGHTPHLEHWLRSLKHHVTKVVYQHTNNRFAVYITEISCIYFGEDGQPLYEPVYKAYCEIVGIINPNK